MLLAYQGFERGVATFYDLPGISVLLGGLVIVLSFTLDYRNIMAGGMPHPFHWGVFGLGMGIGVVSYGRAA